MKTITWTELLPHIAAALALPPPPGEDWAVLAYHRTPRRLYELRLMPQSGTVVIRSVEGEQVRADLFKLCPGLEAAYELIREMEALP